MTGKIKDSQHKSKILGGMALSNKMDVIMDADADCFEIAHIYLDWLPIVGVSTFALLICIAAKNARGQSAFSRSQLVEMTGMSKTTLKTCLDELVRVGLVVRNYCHLENKGRTTNTYILSSYF